MVFGISLKEFIGKTLSQCCHLATSGQKGL
ncbi:unnamed protein product, partial [Adineta steineri]